MSQSPSSSSDVNKVYSPNGLVLSAESTMPLCGDMNWIAAQVAPDTSEAAMRIAAWRASIKLRKIARPSGRSNNM